MLKTSTGILHFIVQWLAMNVADKNAKNAFGDTPLLQAVHGKKLKIAQWLATNGADINTKNFQSNTLLHIAVYNGYLEIVQCLVMNGADINAENKKRYTPFQEAYADTSKWLKDLLTNNRKCTECRRWTLISKLKNEVCFECQWQRIRLLWIAKKKNEGPFSYLPAEIVREIINNF